MAGSQKEFELLFRLKASLGSNFNSTFKSAIETQKKLQDSLKSVNSLQGKIDGYNKASSAIGQQNEKLARLQTEHQNTIQKIQAHQQNAERLRIKIEETGDETGELTAQLVKEENEIQKNTEKLRSNETQIQRTNASIQQQTQRLESMGEELREAGVNTDNLEEANGRLQRSYERLQNSQQTLQRLNQAQQNINESISRTKTQLAGTVGAMAAAGAAIYNGPVTKAAEFQEQMSTVQAISGATGKELRKLSEKAKEMGATTSFTAKEAGEALEYMAVAGWSTKEMMDGVSGVMNLAAASGADLGTTSDIVTDSIENFGLTARDTEHFVNVMAQTARKSNTDVLKLGESYQYVSPVAKAMGYSVEDINVALGLMANSGIKASAGGTALRTLLTNMAKPTDKMSQAMDELGVSLDDGNGNMKSFHEVMVDLRKGFGEVKIPIGQLAKKAYELDMALKGGDISQKAYDKSMTRLMTRAYGAEGALKAQAAATLAGKEGMSGLLAIVNASDKTFKSLTKDIRNADGAAGEMAETKLDNYYGQLTLMQSAWDGLQVELGTLLLPTLTEGIKKLTGIVEVVSNFVKENPEAVKAIAKMAAGLLVFRTGMLSLKLAGLTGAGGILSLMQQLMGLRIGFLESTAAGASFVTKLKTIGSGLLGYFQGVGGALGGLGSAVGNIFSSSTIFQKVGGLFSGIAEKMSAGLEGLAGKLGGALMGTGSKLLSFLLKPFRNIGGVLGSILSKVGGIILSSPLGSIGKVIASGFGKLGTLIAPIGNVLKTALGPLGGLLKTTLGPLGGIAGKFLPVVGIITTIIAAVQILRKNLDKVREAVGNVFGEKGLKIFDKMAAVITNIGKTIKGVFSDGNIGAARDKMKEIFGEKGVAVFDTFAGVFQKIVTAAGQFVDFVTTHIVPVVEQVFRVMVTSVIPGIINGIQAAAPAVMQVFQAIAGFMAGVIPVIGSFIAGIMPVISEVIAFIQTYVFPIISKVFNFIVSTVLPMIAQGIRQLGAVITTVLSAVLPVVQQVFSAVWSIIQPILAQILSTVQVVLPAVLSVFQSVFHAIGGVISAAQQIFNGLIQFITGVFTGNWSSAWNGVKSIFSGVWNGIKSICTGVINGIVGAVNTVIRGLNSLKIPDWVPGIGGKGISIPEIPQLAKGSGNTPDTFIAGEKGPELITNAPGRTVYTARQTQEILKAQSQAGSAAAAAQAAGAASITIKSIEMGVTDMLFSAIKGIMDGIGREKETIGGMIGKTAGVLRIPGFAKGSGNTPDTFIAGEKGPELITNAPGRTVYTARQTQEILKAQSQAGSAVAAVQAAGIANITSNNATENVPGVSAPELKSITRQSSITVTIDNNPIIHVDGEKPGDLEEKLEENNRRLLQQVKNLLDKMNDDERRSAYA